jgi:Na+/H+ antiporter NhaD/arsenite permease-like protein
MPAWTMVPFVALLLSMAVLPVVLPKFWEHRWFQTLVVLACAGPVVGYLVAHGHASELGTTAHAYMTFITTLGALFVTAGGVYAMGDLDASPRTNVAFLVVGSILASLIGTTGASVLVLRPLLRTNSQRQHTAHLVPFFILAVANAGGLLTPLGDPPLLVGFISGVPFFWTLNLFPVWLLYVGSFALSLYFVDRRAYTRESASALARDRVERAPIEVKGWFNLALMACIVGAAFLPLGVREIAMGGIAAASYFGTSRDVHERNQFSMAPIIEVALLFAGLFACLVPIERVLAESASELPIKHAWQLFWVSGVLSALLDNAPAYAALAALCRGLSAGQPDLVAGIAPIKLAAISVGSVVMGATTYIGNGPNLIVKAMAERSGHVLPSFVRFALFAFLAMLPAHVVMTALFIFLER